VAPQRRRKSGRRPPTGQPTRLQAWLDQNDFTSAELEAVIGISRQSMTKIRNGRNARQRTMLAILRGCRALAKRPVEMHEIFDLDPDSPQNLSR
jgi:DNA-binding Xre family transcriptional regulator